MSDSAKIAACAAVLGTILLAGCATDQQEGTRAPDWEAETIIKSHEEVPAAPATTAPVAQPAPPPTAPPAVTSAQSPTNQPPPTWVPLIQWCAANGFERPSAMTLNSFPAFTLDTTNGSFVLRAGSPLAQWNGLEIRLAYAPQLIGNQPFIHSLDLTKTMQPLVAGTPALQVVTNPIIVIDPGHGGEDAGARSALGVGYERDFTLDWARRLAPLLAANGWRVFLTRTNDSHVSLSNRVAFAEEHKADLFVSLHFNSAGANQREAGVETYCVTPPGMFSTVTREFGDNPTVTFPNNAFDGQNLQLAFRVHQALLLATGDRDRGVRRARFLSVLRAQNRPAILIEGGYLSNPQDAHRIADPAYRQRLAEGVAKALCELPEAGAQLAEATRQKSELRSQRSEVSPSTPSNP